MRRIYNDMNPAEVHMAKCVEEGVVRAFQRMEAEMERRPSRWRAWAGTWPFALLAIGIGLVALDNWKTGKELQASEAKVDRLELYIETAMQPPEPVPAERPYAETRGVVR